MKKELKRILSNLVEYQTISGNYQEINTCYQYLIQELSWYPFHVKSYTHNQARSVVWSTVKHLHPKIILNAHIDVVPGDKNLYTMREKSGRWHGRGVLDMKFAVASFILALKNLYRQNRSLPSLAIMLTADEEIGGQNGVNYLVNTIGYRSEIVFIPDGGSNWHLVKESKGALHIKVTSQGKSAHASEPWQGKSAIDALIQNLEHLRSKYPVSSTTTEGTTLVIGTILGGQKTNQVADYAAATLDFRYPPKVNPQQIMSDLYRIFGRARVKTLVAGNPFSCDLVNPYVKLWVNLIKPYQPDKIYLTENGASDGRYFSAHKIPVIVSQPNGGHTHGNHEYLEIKSALVYTTLLTRWLNRVQ